MKFFVAVHIIMLLLLTSCVKSLEKEGVTETTIYTGRIVQGKTGTPIPNVTTMIINGNRIYTSMKTGTDGRFELTVNYKDVNPKYRIVLDDGIHAEKSSSLRGFGLPVYDFKDIILYE